MDHRAVTAIAKTQHGLISRRQVFDAGGSARSIRTMLDAGIWAADRPGVYIVGAADATWARRVMSACMSAGPDARASHLTAIRLHGLVDRSGRLELITDGYRRVRTPGVMVHRTIHLADEDISEVQGIPVTSVSRALIDVGGRQTEATLGRWIDRALMNGELDLAALARRTNELTLPGRIRPTQLMKAVAARGDGHDPGRSVFEARVIAAMKARNMRELVRQHPVVRPDGRKAFIDLADPPTMTAIELDGWETHGVRSAFDADRIRGNELLLLGWNLLRFTWTMSDDYICGTVDAAIDHALDHAG
jgi:hypothetical protein